MSNASFEHAKIVGQYSAVDAAAAAQRAFASQSLITEGYAFMGDQWGLHSQEHRFGVEDWLRLGAPINGVAKINYGDDLEHWETPLLTAFVDGRLDAADALIDNGADIDAPNAIVFPNGEVLNHTALHMLSQRGINAGAARLVAAGADVNRQTNLGTTPLHFAAGKDNVELVLILLRAGADRRIREFNSDQPGGWGELPLEQAGPRTRPLLS